MNNKGRSQKHSAAGGKKEKQLTAVGEMVVSEEHEFFQQSSTMVNGSAWAAWAFVPAFIFLEAPSLFVKVTLFPQMDFAHTDNHPELKFLPADH